MTTFRFTGKSDGRLVYAEVDEMGVVVSQLFHPDDGKLHRVGEILGSEDEGEEVVVAGFDSVPEPNPDAEVDAEMDQSIADLLRQ